MQSSPSPSHWSWSQCCCQSRKPQEARRWQQSVRLWQKAGTGPGSGGTLSLGLQRTTPLPDPASKSRSGHRNRGMDFARSSNCRSSAEDSQFVIGPQTATECYERITWMPHEGIMYFVSSFEIRLLENIREIVGHLMHDWKKRVVHENRMYKITTNLKIRVDSDSVFSPKESEYPLRGGVQVLHVQGDGRGCSRLSEQDQHVVARISQ